MAVTAMEGYPMAPGLNKDEAKEAFKEAIKEWLDDVFMKFGKWSLAAIGATALVLLLKAAVQFNVWRH